MNQPFHFKQFSVSQDQCAMKVGTDGVLLGAWAGKNSDPYSILDVGAGTGLISLMLAQRFTVAQIEAIEIEDLAYEQCVENFENSEWSDRLFCYHCSFNQFVEEWDESYDLIVSNPPFFTEDTFSNDEQRDLARFNSSLPFSQLFEGAQKLLATEGRFVIIAPILLEEELLILGQRFNLFAVKKLYVKGNPSTPFKRILLEFQRKNSAIETSELTIENTRHNYTEDYKNLTKDFYLKF